MEHGRGARATIMRTTLLLLLTAVPLASVEPIEAVEPERLRLLIETDAGGDPDDEQSLVRFLLYTSEWDVEGILCTRPTAREGENRNKHRTGLGIVRAMLDAYGECHPNLVKHDKRFPTRQYLWDRTVAGYDDTDDAVNLIIAAADKPDDARPIWFCNWGTDRGSAGSNLRRALDRVFKERGPEGYARFKSRFRLSSDDQFGDHTTKIAPPFVLWVDTFRPELDRKRWYHRFSALTATAGGFDIRRDVLTGHGPLGALYPLNTTHPQKEGDSMTFLYLVPTGMNDPDQPTWGSWAGRYGPREGMEGKSYFWANQKDHYNGVSHRENTLSRWAVHIQNDFAARMDWCVADDFAKANHPPRVSAAPPPKRAYHPGETVTLDGSASSDPDGQQLSFDWSFYPEPGTYRGPLPTLRTDANGASATFLAPNAQADSTLHLILSVTDKGLPPLTRYQRVVIAITPRP